jgi:hypothetical protein
LTIKTQWLKFNDKILKKQYVLHSLARSLACLLERIRHYLTSLCSLVATATRHDTHRVDKKDSSGKVLELDSGSFEAETDPNMSETENSDSVRCSLADASARVASSPPSY